MNGPATPVWRCSVDELVYPDVTMAKCGSGYQMTLSWIPAECGTVPPNALDAGGKVYVCRAEHDGEILPGKLMGATRSAYVSLSGKEYEKLVYDVLCETGVNCNHTFEWKKDCDGKIPENSLVAGITVNKEPLYVARIYCDGEYAVGKVHESHGCAYFPYKGKEIPADEYEVLVWKEQ
ncbi:Natterin-4 [Clonorchis sinensis]|uniref:Natterin-4 n=1 Tax=Clonorchis sinensis TaxID=79923 RepID=A0A8T1M0L6_CLOSI|nr:Natterin-4 [Clonorchis sinensis]